MGLAEPSHLGKPTPVRESGVVSGTLGTNLTPARLRDAIPGTISVSCFCRCGLRLGLPACLPRGAGCLGPTCRQEPDHSGEASLGQVGLGKEWSWRKNRRSSLFCPGLLKVGDGSATVLFRGGWPLKSGGSADLSVWIIFCREFRRWHSVSKIFFS